jgi:hypothetical protein
MSTPGLRLASLALWQATASLLLVACTHAVAQDKPKQTLPPVTVAGTSVEQVEKSYRQMLRGMDYFEQARATLAPQATLRFKLLPRKPGTDMDHIVLEVLGDSFDYRVPIAPDHTFVLDRDARALKENAVITPNRRKLSMTWRTEIRTPGLPPNTRRLGDLRLECLVGLQADLVSNNGPIGRIADLFSDKKRYCERNPSRYLYFAERPLFSVTLVDGARRETLPIDQLYAGASDDPGLKSDLPYCDCEMLVDRTYFLPLGDRRWPDDTRVEFEFMDDRP